MSAMTGGKKAISVEALQDAMRQLIAQAMDGEAPFAPPPSLRSAARAIFATRRERTKYLPKSLLGEPAWDILLILYIEGREDEGLSTKFACIAADVPQTTAWRYIQVLKEKGLIERVDDFTDARLSRIRLTDIGLKTVESCVRSLVEFG